MDIVAPALVTGLLVTAVHAPLGMEVLKRGIVFVDLAMAQGVGLVLVLLALWLEEPSWTLRQAVSFGAGIGMALFFRWIERVAPDEQEAVIGSSFVVAGAATLLALAGNSRGGEDWMLPLLELRQLLKDTQDPARKAEFRDLKHRNGRLVFWNDRLTRGPYTLEFRKTLLRRLLEAQNAVRASGPDPEIELIRADEVGEIQRLWRVEQGDWRNSALAVYREVAGVDLERDPDDLGAFGGVEQSELEAACGLHGLPYGLLARALEAEAGAQGMAKRHGIHGRIAGILAEEWADDTDAAARAESERRQRRAGEI